MFARKLPALAAAGTVAVLAVGGVCGLPGPALADDGGTGAATSSPLTSAPAPDPPADTGTGADPSTGASTVPSTVPSTDPLADPGASTDLGTSADPGTGTDTTTGTSTDAGTGTNTGTSTDIGTDTGSDPYAGTGTPSGGAMDVSPQSVAPGGVVTLHLATSCSTGKQAKASASVFVDTVTLAPAGDGQGMDGSAFIRSDAAAGSYRVSVRCDGATSSAQASLTVIASGGATPVTPTAPVRPVPAGGGGAAEQLAAGPAVAGTSTGPLLATGGAAAVGLIGLVGRRRFRARRSGTRG